MTAVFASSDPNYRDVTETGTVLISNGVSQTFFDDFNRSDGPAGNGWTPWGNGGTLSGAQLRTSGQPNVAGGVLRSLPLNFPLRFSFDFRTDTPVDGGWSIAFNASLATPFTGAQLTLGQYVGRTEIFQVYQSASGAQFRFIPAVAGQKDYEVASFAHISGVVHADLSALITISYGDGNTVSVSVPAPPAGAIVVPQGSLLLLGNSNASLGPHYFDNFSIESFAGYSASAGLRPEAQGFSYSGDNANAAPSVAGGTLQVTTTAGEQYWSATDSSIDFSQHVVLDAELHIRSSNYVPNIGTGTREGYYLWVDDIHGNSYTIGLAGAGFNINSISVPNQPLTPYPYPVTDTFHRYRLVIDGFRGSFFIDGRLVRSDIAPAAHGTQPRVVFGAVDAASRSDTSLNYLCFGTTVSTCSFPTRFAYVPNQGSSSVSAYAVDPVRGGLSVIEGSPFPTGIQPYAVAVDPSGRFVYVLNYACASGCAASGTISAFAIDNTTGALTPVPGSPFPTGDGPYSLAIAPSGRFAYVANYWSQDVWAYVINPATGALGTGVPGSPLVVGGNPTRIATDPSGRFAYVSNAASNDVSGYSINPTTGALTSIPGSPFGAGTYPHSVTVDPSGRFAFVANAISNNVSAFTINPATGGLTPIAGSPFAAGEAHDAAVDPSGRFLYVPNGTSNNVSVFAINPSTGVLSPIAGSPFTAGSFPRAIAIDPSGRFAYVANYQSSGAVSAFTIDGATGALTPFPESSVTSGAFSSNIATTAGPATRQSDSGSITITPATPMVRVSDGVFPYDGVAHHATAVATGIGGTPVAGSFSFTYTPGGTSPPVTVGTYESRSKFQQH